MEKTAKRKKIHKICLYITHTHSQYTWRHDTNTVTQSLQNFTHTTHRPVSQFSLTKKLTHFTTPDEEVEGTARTLSSSKLFRRSVWRWWRLGVKEAEEVEVNGVKEVEAVSMNFFFFFFKSFCFFKSWV